MADSTDPRDRRMMNIASLAVGMLIVVMATSVVYGVVVGGPAMSELTETADFAWGKATFIDLLTGLLLFVGWVVYRERSWWRALLWAVAFVFIANLGTTLYVFLALRQSTDWREFWMGRA
jgi:hypothetical protein